jgi:hypothetical protein
MSDACPLGAAAWTVDGTSRLHAARIAKTTTVENWWLMMDVRPAPARMVVDNVESCEYLLPISKTRRWEQAHQEQQRELLVIPALRQPREIDQSRTRGNRASSSGVLATRPSEAWTSNINCRGWRSV